MTERPVAILDASVGVKWFKDETGSAAARDLLERHRGGSIRLIVPAIFIHEVTAVALRHRIGREAWSLLRDADLTVVTLDDALAGEAFEQCEVLGCCFYDALAPALAKLLGGTLYSADVKAHGRFEGVRLLV